MSDDVDGERVNSASPRRGSRQVLLSAPMHTLLPMIIITAEGSHRQRGPGLSRIGASASPGSAYARRDTTPGSRFLRIAFASIKEAIVLYLQIGRDDRA